MKYLVLAAGVGVGATLMMDLWTLIRRAVFMTPFPDYAMVGRWLAHMKHGRFRHQAISASPAMRGERCIGWAAHYLIGIVFAFVLFAVWSSDWIEAPTLGAALIVGIGSVAFPFLLMQPAMGAGIAARRTARPASARLQSLITHTVFGFGLYLAGWGVHYLGSF